MHLVRALHVLTSSLAHRSCTREQCPQQWGRL